MAKVVNSVCWLGLFAPVSTGETQEKKMIELGICVAYLIYGFAESILVFEEGAFEIQSYRSVVRSIARWAIVTSIFSLALMHYVEIGHAKDHNVEERPAEIVLHEH